MSTEEGLPGEFWLATEPSRRVKGTLYLTDGIRVELEDSLTSMWVFHTIRDESGNVHEGGGPRKNSEMPPPFTVLGEVSGNDSGEVTLRECTSASWSPNLRSPGTDEPQILRPMYALLNGHSADGKALTGLELEVRHLATWLEVERADSAAMSNGARVTLELTSGGSPCLRVEGLAPSNFREIERYFLFPMSQLVSLGLMVHSPLVSARLYDETNRAWLDLYTDYLAPRESFPWSARPFTLMQANDIDAEGVARWLDECQKLVPLPSIVAGTVDAEAVALDSSLLQLTTATEGLHIRLCDKPLPPVGRDIVRQIRRVVGEALRGVGLSVEYVEMVDKKLELLRHRTFRDGLRKLIEDYGTPASKVLGRRDAWISYVQDYRNEFAHWKEGSEGVHTDNFSSYEAVALSLRWFLVSVLLQVAGMDETVLRDRLAGRPDFRDFTERAPGLLPDVYAGLDEG